MPYQFGNQAVTLSKEPRNLNGPVYAPLREVIEQLGGKITWDNASKTAGATLKGRHARIPNDSSTVDVDGTPVNMSVPTLFLDEEVWVPIEFFGLAFAVPAYAEAGNLVRLDNSSVA